MNTLGRVHLSITHCQEPALPASHLTTTPPMPRGSAVYERNQTRTRCEKRQLNAHIQDSASHVPWERGPLEGYERDALFLLPTCSCDLSLKALPVVLCYLKIMASRTSIIHKWIIHLED